MRRYEDGGSLRAKGQVGRPYGIDEWQHPRSELSSCTPLSAPTREKECPRCSSYQVNGQTGPRRVLCEPCRLWLKAWAARRYCRCGAGPLRSRRRRCDDCLTWCIQGRRMQAKFNRSNRPKVIRQPENDSLHRRSLKYGVDIAELLTAQGGVCAINGCERLATEVDHDHSCCPAAGRKCGQCVRGLLCGRCNRTLGGADDSVVRLRALIVYLEK